jgi:hypothetical protein
MVNILNRGIFLDFFSSMYCVQVIDSSAAPLTPLCRNPGLLRLRHWQSDMHTLWRRQPINQYATTLHKPANPKNKKQKTTFISPLFKLLWLGSRLAGGGGDLWIILPFRPGSVATRDLLISTPRPMTRTACQPWVAGSRLLSVLKMEAYGTVQTVLLGAVRSHVLARPELQL